MSDVTEFYKETIKALRRYYEERGFEISAWVKRTSDQTIWEKLHNADLLAAFDNGFVEITGECAEKTSSVVDDEIEYEYGECKDINCIEITKKYFQEK